MILDSSYFRLLLVLAITVKLRFCNAARSYQFHSCYKLVLYFMQYTTVHIKKMGPFSVLFSAKFFISWINRYFTFSAGKTARKITKYCDLSAFNQNLNQSTL